MKTWSNQAPERQKKIQRYLQSRIEVNFGSLTAAKDLETDGITDMYMNSVDDIPDVLEAPDEGLDCFNTGLDRYRTSNGIKMPDVGVASMIPVSTSTPPYSIITPIATQICAGAGPSSEGYSNTAPMMVREPLT